MKINVELYWRAARTTIRRDISALRTRRSVPSESKPRISGQTVTNKQIVRAARSSH